MKKYWIITTSFLFLLANCTGNKNGADPPATLNKPEAFPKREEAPSNYKEELKIAIYLEDTENIKRILEKDIDLNAVIFDENGWTALIIASYQGYIEAIELLLKKGADPNAKSKNSFDGTALMWASYKGHIEAMKLLLKHSADINAKSDKYKETALMIASTKQAVRLLLEKGADVNARNSSNRTALGIALKENRPEIAKLLKSYGAVE
ncbi:MAG: ankyrin repeat domain-containing protein [Oligoflexia bacterium]|nr:ankyrin repeat domain-containing protein [Oligoflexia bacterium]